MTILSKLHSLMERVRRGSDEQRAPEPGNGAVVHDSSGNVDFDGLPGDVLPPRKENSAEGHVPEERAGD